MQFINKQVQEPPVWNVAFTTATGNRSFDYGADYENLPRIRMAKQYLLEEQHGLCAYCQQPLNIENSSIEHVIPKSKNVRLSTNYHNLILVCINRIKDPINGKLHCDKERGDLLIPPTIFYKESKCSSNVHNLPIISHKYFMVSITGEILVKPNLPSSIEAQAKAFIEILNLNHSILMKNRSESLKIGFIEIFKQLDNNRKKIFWQVQYQRIQRISTIHFVNSY